MSASASPQTLMNSMNVPELQKRLTFLATALLIFVFGNKIPAPGIDSEIVANFFSRAGDGIFGLLNLFTGGGLSQFSIFALGIMPYINASIMMQLLTAIDPNLKEMQQEGEEGRKKIGMYTRYLAVALAFLQAGGMMVSIYGGFGPVISDFGAVSALFAVVAGSCFLMWLGDEISDKGVGNGMSILITVGIVAVIPTMILQELSAASLQQSRVLALVIFAILTIVIVTGIVYIQLSARRIPVQYARRQIGRKVYGGQNTYLPIKIAQAGVIPIIFAISVIMVPGTILGFNQQWQGANAWWAWFQASPWNPLVQFLLVFFFTFVYTAVTFNTQDIADNLKKNNGFIPGIRPGKPTFEFLDKVLHRVTFFGALFLGLVTILPIFVNQMVGAMTNVTINSFYLGGTSLLIVVGVALDTVQQMQAHMIMRHYSGLTRS